jgi:FtsZ-binding cell division protein ZapB
MDARPDRKFSVPSSSTAATSPTNSTSNGLPPSGKKQRTSASGSRGVANLTPEQLAKKRANDREAQRAIRERTKGQIETLERKIEDLTSQQPYQELRHAIQQKEAVEAENEDIKRRLNSVLSIIQPLLGGNGASGNT